MGCAVASIIIGAFGAYNEPSLQRFLGFSSISNMGFILASLSLGTYDGLYAAIYYFFVYLLTMLLVFAILFVLRKDKDFSLIKNITDLSTISHGSPWLSMSLGCALFSLAGIPPFGGFFGKFAIIIAYLNSANFLVALCLLLLSV